MKTFDLATRDLEPVGGPAGFDATERAIADRIGAEHLAGTVIEIAPGNAANPYHWEADQEEWLLVLSGTPSARTPEGTEALVPGDLVVFGVGPDGAHQVRNDSDAPCRVLILSTRSAVNVIVYPDSGKVGVRTPWVGTNHALDAALDYWAGE